MGSIVEVTKQDKKTGKPVVVFRAFIRRSVEGRQVSRTKVFETKGQAKEWLRNNESDAALAAATTKPRGITFASVAKQFTEAPPVRGTKFWNPSQLDFWIEEFGDIHITRLSRRDINAAVAKLQNCQARRMTSDGLKPTGEKLTPGTINRYLATLSSVLNYAINHEIIDVHPLKAGKVRKLKETGGRRRILTAEEEQRLLDAAKASSWPMMHLFLRMLMTTASRKSEVLKLRWKDVHLVESVAIVPHTKNDEPRALPLVSDVKAALAEARKVRPINSDFVFYDPRHPARPKNVDTIWRFVRERAGLLKDRADRLDRVVMHSTRHTAVTKMIKGGANLGQIAAVSGHKTLAMLKRYTHMDTASSVDLAEKLLAGDLSAKKGNTAA